MKNRIVGYDIARAFAIFGMVIVNFKIVMGAEQSGPGWLVNLVGLLDGRAAATFVVLAGIGLSLLSQKGRTAGDLNQITQDRNTLLKRALFLFVAGMLYTPIYDADILHFYGVYIAFAAFLITAPTRRLWIFSWALLLLFVVLILLLDYEKGWNWSTLEYEGFWTTSGIFRHLFFNGFHPVIPWLAFLLFGLILGRQDMGDRLVRRRIFLWGAGTAIITEGVSRFLVYTFSQGSSLTDQELIAGIFGTDPMPPMPFYMLAGAGTACAIIVASIELGERHGAKAWLRPFVATGQLALTLYVAHVIIGMGTLEAIGRLENQTLLFALSASMVFCLTGVVFSYLWRRRFKRGPFEAIMRRLTDPKNHN